MVDAIRLCQRAPETVQGPPSRRCAYPHSARIHKSDMGKGEKGTPFAGGRVEGRPTSCRHPPKPVLRIRSAMPVTQGIWIA
jgi:hypothetical protein